MTRIEQQQNHVTFSNGIRLRGREWLGVGLFALLVVLIAPSAWKRVETFSVEPDYRIPHDLGYDYWLYERYAGLATERYDTLVIGDSVVWGEYVTRKETLSHYLNESVGEERYANLGLDGAHPLALAGLIEHYAGAVRNKNVVLQCNTMWLREPRTDLQDDKADVNHPRLIPQFVPHIPAYHAEVSPRIGVIVEEHVPFNSWTNHLQQAYYEGKDIPSWTMEHPRENPLKQLTHGLPPADDSRRQLNLPWYKTGKTKEDFPWVDLGTSLQWPAFQRAVKLLKDRGNRVFVLVGPFNEHMLTDDSLKRYREVKKGITAWLEAEGIAHLAPEPLPSEQYGDASHPLPEGYARLARELLKQPFFKAHGE